MNFYDFNTAEVANFNLIPNSTLVKLLLSIKPGGYNDPSQDWSGGYATQSQFTGAVYLSCEYTVLGGKYHGRKIWDKIGIYSHKNDNIWGQMGRSFIRSIISSSTGFKNSDNSPEAIAVRTIKSFADIDGIEFIARVGEKEENDGKSYNIVKTVIGPEHAGYQQLMMHGSSNHDLS